MYLSPTEHDRLLVFQAAQLARRTRAAGNRLSAPEAIAIICDDMHAAARSGASYDEVLKAGQSALGPADVMDGVPELVPDIRLEVLLGDGSRLIVLRNPLGTPAGPQRSAAGDIELNRGRSRITMEVRSRSLLLIRVSSHFPFWLANKRLVFDREAARGFHLDIEAGASVRWAPRQSRTVSLVAYAGEAAPR